MLRWFIRVHAPSFRYPYNLDFDYGALEGLTQYSINNLGDPFIESNYGVHSREFEVSCSVELLSKLERQEIRAN